MPINFPVEFYAKVAPVVWVCAGIAWTYDGTITVTIIGWKKKVKKVCF